MNTPICEFVNNYVNQSPVRAHMPGHKGHGPLNAERWDITEIDGAGVLYGSAHRDVIAQSEANAAVIFQTAKTLYSTEGASLPIRAMLYLAQLHAQSQGLAPVILAGRNAHKSFLTGAALLDLRIEWLLPEDGSLLSCEIAPEVLAARLDTMPQRPSAVYVTSPDYLGTTADLPALAAVCHARGCLLLVDNAHGAYLRFLPEDRHPITQGADICCDSAHKTLPVLTGGAYLHLSKHAPAALIDAAEVAMQLFASTSPSYLILQSLDAANPMLAGHYPERLACFCAQIGRLMDRLTRHGYALRGDEPLKLTLDAKGFGYSGTALSALLRERGIVCEFADPDVTVLMLTPENSAEDLSKIEAALLAIPKLPPISTRPPKLPSLQTVCTPRQAMFAPSEALPVTECDGRIIAQPSVGCPPAVPIAVCGERLTQSHLTLFRYYGIESCRVIKSPT